MDLEEGIKLLDSASATLQAPSRLMLSSGIGPAPDACRPSGYEEGTSIPFKPGAVVPHPGWRTATALELQLLCASAVPADRGSWITIVRIPERILEAFSPALNVLKTISKLSYANDYFSRLPQLEDAIA